LKVVTEGTGKHLGGAEGRFLAGHPVPEWERTRSEGGANRPSNGVRRF